MLKRTLSLITCLLIVLSIPLNVFADGDEISMFEWTNNGARIASDGSFHVYFRAYLPSGKFVAKSDSATLSIKCKIKNKDTGSIIKSSDVSFTIVFKQSGNSDYTSPTLYCKADGKSYSETFSVTKGETYYFYAEVVDGPDGGWYISGDGSISNVTPA